MITISKIPDGEKWAEEIAQARSKGMRTNFYAAAEDFFPHLQQLSELKFDGGRYLFHEKEGQIDFYFFLEQDARPVPLPMFAKPVVLEQVGVTKAPPALAQWLHCNISLPEFAATCCKFSTCTVEIILYVLKGQKFLARFNHTIRKSFFSNWSATC